MRCEVKNYLRSWNLSRTKVTEYDLIMKLIEEAEKMLFCPVYRHSLGIIILAAM